MVEMKNKRKFDEDFKKSLVTEIESGYASWSSIMKKHRISKDTLTGWVIKYGSHQISEIHNSGQTNRYNDSFISHVVKCYNEEKIPIKDIALKYRVSCGTIRNWVKRYGSGITRSKYVSYWTSVMTEY